MIPVSLTSVQYVYASYILYFVFQSLILSLIIYIPLKFISHFFGVFVGPMDCVKQLSVICGNNTYCV